MDRVEAKPQKRVKTRIYYNCSFKKIVVGYSDQHGNRAAARKYGVNESNIRRWRKRREEIKVANPKRKSFTGPRRGRFKEVDDAVANWIRNLTDKGVRISRKAVRIEALRTATALNIPREQFGASYGWIRRLMRRSGLSLSQTTISQNECSTYQRSVIKLRRKHDYDLGAMGSADETPIFFDIPNGNKKLRISVMLSVLADGTKLPPFIIFKGKSMPEGKPPRGLFIRCQERGWMTTQLMFEWLENVWNKRPKASLRRRSMLVLDAFEGQLEDELKQKINSYKTDLVIPDRTTSISQMLDVVSKPFKDHLKELYNSWLTNSEHEYPQCGNIKEPMLQVICKWIIEAWNTISEESIKQGFTKSCISNAMDGTDYILWDDQEIDIPNNMNSSGSDPLADPEDVANSDLENEGDSDMEYIESECKIESDSENEYILYNYLC